MNTIKKFSGVSSAVLSACAAGLIMMAGCVVYDNGTRAGPHNDSYVSVDGDDYIYYPRYDVYYSSRNHQYAYMEGNVWVMRPAPPSVSVSVLYASPSVKMDFHDSPAAHHNVVARKYPRNWAPPAQNEGRKEKPKHEKNVKKDKHDDKAKDQDKRDEPPARPSHDDRR